jgi:hypothetical protein
VARYLGVSRARVAQILELALPPVTEQERVVWLEAVDKREPGQAFRSGTETQASGALSTRNGARTPLRRRGGST